MAAGSDVDSSEQWSGKEIGQAAYRQIIEGDTPKPHPPLPSSDPDQVPAVNPMLEQIRLLDDFLDKSESALYVPFEIHSRETSRKAS